MKKQIILASTSKYRKAILDRIGLSHDAFAPDCDEDKYKNEINDATQLVQILAKEKAMSLAEKYPDAIIIGSDQLAHLDGEILGKPHAKENAVAQLTKMNNKTHELLTAVFVYSKEKSISYLDTTKLTMRNLSKTEIENYVQNDNPIDCAGAYKLEKEGILLFNKIDTKDFNAITGLPIIELVDALEKLNVKVLL